LCPTGTLSFNIPPDLVFHAGPAHFVIHAHTFAPSIELLSSSIALVSIAETNASVAVMQVW
jgi:hypothetical protein